MTPARFLRRYVAWSLDALVLLAPVLLLCRRHLAQGLARIGERFDALADMVATSMIELADMAALGTPLAEVLAHWMRGDGFREAATGLAGAVASTLWWPLLVFALLAGPWFAAFEASAWQATPGKRAMRLQVVRRDGARPEWHRAIVRQCAGLLSWLSLNVGHMLAEIPPQRRALHDYLAGTRVLQAQARMRLPAWARAWLLLQLAALFAALAWVGWHAERAMEAAFNRLL